MQVTKDHIEDTTACTAPVTAHTVLVQHAWRMQQHPLFLKESTMLCVTTLLETEAAHTVYETTRTEAVTTYSASSTVSSDSETVHIEAAIAYAEGPTCNMKPGTDYMVPVKSTKMT